MALIDFLSHPRWALGRRLIVGALIGIAAGFAAVGFRYAFSFLSHTLLHSQGEGIAQAHPIFLFFIPALGGLGVGLLILSTSARFGQLHEELHRQLAEGSS